jgi:fucose permease
MVAVAIILVIEPITSILWVVIFLNFLIAFAMGVVDVTANTLFLSIWSTEEIGPWIQFLHFCFGLGATFSPFLVGFMIDMFPETRTNLIISYWTLAGLALLLVIPNLALEV